MTEYKVLNKEKLEEILKRFGHTIVKIVTQIDTGDEDDNRVDYLSYIMDCEMAESADKAYYGGFLWEYLVVKDYCGGKLVDLHGSNVNTDDTTIERLNTNNYCSPGFHVNGDSILLTSNLAEWLNYNNIDYSSCLEVKKVYDRIRFENAGTPVFDKQGRLEGISSETLVITEDELEAGLNEITNHRLVAKLKEIVNEYGIRERIFIR